MKNFIIVSLMALIVCVSGFIASADELVEVALHAVLVPWNEDSRIAVDDTMRIISYPSRYTGAIFSFFCEGENVPSIIVDTRNNDQLVGIAILEEGIPYRIVATWIGNNNRIDQVSTEHTFYYRDRYLYAYFDVLNTPITPRRVQPINTKVNIR